MKLAVLGSGVGIVIRYVVGGGVAVGFLPKSAAVFGSYGPRLSAQSWMSLNVGMITCLLQ